MLKHSLSPTDYSMLNSNIVQWEELQSWVYKKRGGKWLQKFSGFYSSLSALSPLLSLTQPPSPLAFVAWVEEDRGKRGQEKKKGRK